MISPLGMRGKWAADRPGVPAVPRPSRPLGPSSDLGGRAAQDRPIEFGRCPPALATCPTPAQSGSLFAAAGQSSSRPRGPCVPWASHRARLEAHRALAWHPWPPPPIFLRSLSNPRGRQATARRSMPRRGGPLTPPGTQPHPHSELVCAMLEIERRGTSRF
jgi:hypothetical protein